MVVGADHDVVEHRHPVEEAEPLEGAGHAEAGEVARAQALDPLPASYDVAAVGLHEAARDVEEGGLPGTVGADDPVHLARADREADVLEGGEPAEGDGDAAELEFGHERV